MNNLKKRQAADGAVVAGLGVWLLIHSVTHLLNMKAKASWIMSPYLFPLILAGAVIILGLTILIPAFAADDRKETTDQEKHGNSLRVFILLAISIVYDILMRFAGFIPSTAAVVLAMTAFLGERRLKILIPMAVFTPVVLTLIFKVGLGVRLP